MRARDPRRPYLCLLRHTARAFGATCWCMQRGSRCATSSAGSSYTLASRKVVRDFSADLSYPMCASIGKRVPPLDKADSSPSHRENCGQPFCIGKLSRFSQGDERVFHGCNDEIDLKLNFFENVFSFFTCILRFRGITFSVKRQAQPSNHCT